MNDWRQGVDRIPAHFFGLGIPFGFLAWYGGWGVLPALVAWRAYAEYQDWKQSKDTMAKALIDLASQIVVTIIVVVWHASH